MVLLHGWPTSWREWRGVMLALAAAGFTVVAPDLRALGDTERSATGYDNATVANDVRALVRLLGHEHVNVVGTDIGMTVAFSWALRHGDEIARLVPAESLLPGFGLEELMNAATGAYWHFGFNAQVDTAEMLTAGKEAVYLGRNWKIFAQFGGFTAGDRAEWLRTYAAPGAIRAGFRHYEALVDDGKAIRNAFSGKLTIPVLILNAELCIPQQQTQAGVEQAFSNVQHDRVLLAGHRVHALGRLIDEEGGAGPRPELAREIPFSRPSPA